MELGRFALHLISMEEMRVERFQDGLQSRIRIQVARLHIKDFHRLENVASIVKGKHFSLAAATMS